MRQCLASPPQVGLDCVSLSERLTFMEHASQVTTLEVELEQMEAELEAEKGKAR